MTDPAGPDALAEEVARRIALRMEPDNAVQRARIEQAIVDACFALRSRPAQGDEK